MKRVPSYQVAKGTQRRKMPTMRPLALILALATSSFAQTEGIKPPPPVPGEGPPHREGDRRGPPGMMPGMGKGPPRFDGFDKLSEAELQKVRTAFEKAWQRPEVIESRDKAMKANEEIAALRTFGFNAFDFLVLPRLLAMVLMMPLLTVYADIIGIFGGMVVGSFVGITPELYWHETLAAVDMTNASLGVIKSVFFGATIALSGCMMGMQAGKSSAAVGEATTQAVVASITAIVVLDSAFAAIFTLLEI
jgi:hypothetical protein